MAAAPSAMGRHWRRARWWHARPARRARKSAPKRKPASVPGIQRRALTFRPGPALPYVLLALLAVAAGAVTYLALAQAG